jgi:hypothetical protein
MEYITRTLDTSRTTPVDAMNSKFKGIAKQLFNVLFTDILKKPFREQFADRFAATPTSPTWPRNQPLHKYLSPRKISELGRAIIISLVVRRK